MIEEIRDALRRELATAKTSGKKLTRDANLYSKLVSDLLTKVDDPRIGTLIKLSLALGLPRAYLLNDFIPIGGVISGGGVVEFKAGPATDFVPRPPSRKGKLVALRVEGDGLRPLHRDGDVIFISRANERIELDYIGDECVAETADGLTYLRILAHGPDGKSHTLRHWTGFESDETKDARIVWATPVLATIRRSEFGKPNGKANGVKSA